LHGEGFRGGVVAGAIAQLGNVQQRTAVPRSVASRYVTSAPPVM